MEGERARMVAEQLEGRGIKDQRVLAAMLEVPREEFVPPELRGHAYEDRALPIGPAQTISQPLVVAAMTQALDLEPDHVVLEVGGGSGYQAAVLSRCCRRVVSVELEPALAELAAATLKRLGYDNVEVAVGDGKQGWPALAPYQGILVAAAASAIPPDLLVQLDDPGRMVIPVGPDSEGQELQVISKRHGGYVSELLFPVRFVPLI